MGASQAEINSRVLIAADFTPVVGDAKGIVEAIQDPSIVNIAAATVGVVPVVGDIAAKGIKALDNVVDASRRFSSEKEALVDMAQSDARAGVTRADMDAYQELNAGLPDPFPSSTVRLDEGHPGRGEHSQKPHGHVGPIDYIPIKEERR